MPDIADGRSDFKDAIRRNEEAAGIFRDDQGNETYADPKTPEVPELEGAVPVAASDQPLPEPVPTPEAPEAPAEADTPTEQPEAPQSPEELQAEIARLQEQLATKDSFIGRQSTDVGELRAEVDALRAQVTTPPVATPVQPMAITQDMIDNNPAQATQLAFEQAKRAAEANGGVTDPASEHVLAVAFEAWKGDDEFTAGQWLTDRRIEQQVADFDAKLKAVRGEVQQVTAPIAATAAANEAQQGWSNAFLEMQKSYPDFLDRDAEGKTNAQRLLEEVAPQYPAIANLIASGDVAAKVQGLTLLYDKSRLGNPTQVAAELQNAANDAAAEAAATRAAAASVNGQATAGQGSTVEMTLEETEKEAYMTRMASKASLSRGWTGRSA